MGLLTWFVALEWVVRRREEIGGNTEHVLLLLLNLLTLRCG